MFLRIENLYSFTTTVAISFMVEIAGVLWVVRGSHTIQRAKTRLKGMDGILDKVQNQITETDFQRNEFAAEVLATKIGHEELCEKLSMVRFYGGCTCKCIKLINFWLY